MCVCVRERERGFLFCFFPDQKHGSVSAAFSVARESKLKVTALAGGGKSVQPHTELCLYLDLSTRVQALCMPCYMTV